MPSANMQSKREFPAIAGRHRQRGMTLWGLLYVLLTLGLLGMVAAKSLPVYLNAYDIRATLEWAASQPDLQDASAMTIQRAVQRRFDAGYVDNINGRDIAVNRVNGGRELNVSYEVRRPMMFNLSMVYSFDETVPVKVGDGGQ